MKVLFVCRKNNGRSPMAKGITHKLAPDVIADSAGIEVDNPGQTLNERAKEVGSEVGKVIEVMREIGIEVGDHKRTQLDESMLENYDKVILILEVYRVPEYMKNKSNVEIWDIADPKGKGLEGMRKTRDEIKSRLTNFL